MRWQLNNGNESCGRRIQNARYTNGQLEFIPSEQRIWNNHVDNRIMFLINIYWTESIDDRFNVRNLFKIFICTHVYNIGLYIPTLSNFRCNINIAAWPSFRANRSVMAQINKEFNNRISNVSVYIYIYTYICVCVLHGPRSPNTKHCYILLHCRRQRID